MRLRQGDLGAWKMVLVLRFDAPGAAPRRIEVRAGRGLRDPGRWLDLFRERPEAFDPGSGVIRLDLAAGAAEPFDPAAGSDREGLWERLSARLGSRNVVRFRPAARHRPEGRIGGRTGAGSCLPSISCGGRRPLASFSPCGALRPAKLRGPMRPAAAAFRLAASPAFRGEGRRDGWDGLGGIGLDAGDRGGRREPEAVAAACPPEAGRGGDGARRSLEPPAVLRGRGGRPVRLPSARGPERIVPSGGAREKGRARTGGRPRAATTGGSRPRRARACGSTGICIPARRAGSCTGSSLDPTLVIRTPHPSSAAETVPPLRVPSARGPRPVSRAGSGGEAARYAELEAISSYSFLRGASHPEELVRRAADLGLEALGVADHDSLAGAVRVHTAARVTGLRSIVGARLDLADAPSVLAYPCDRAAYGRLSRLLTEGKARAAGRGVRGRSPAAGRSGEEPEGRGRVESRAENGAGNEGLRARDLLAAAEGMALIVLPPDRPTVELPSLLASWRAAFPGQVWLALRRLLAEPPNDVREERAASAARAAGVPLVATNAVLMHRPDRRPVADVLACLRTGRRIDEMGLDLLKNAERRLKSPEEMVRLFRDRPQAVEATLEITGRIDFSLDQLRLDYPDESGPDGRPALARLERAVREGAAERYGSRVPAPVRSRIRARARDYRPARLRPLFPHRVRPRPLCAVTRDPRPGAGFGRQLRRVLRARDHRGRSGPERPSLRALRLGRAGRAAGHRRRLRARAPGRGDPARVRAMGPAPRCAHRDGHPLSRPARAPGGGQGPGAVRGGHVRPRRPCPRRGAGRRDGARSRARPAGAPAASCPGRSPDPSSGFRATSPSTPGGSSSGRDGSTRWFRSGRPPCPAAP